MDLKEFARRGAAAQKAINELGAGPPRYFGWDLAAGPDKTVWHCSECGIGTAPCKHAKDRGVEHD